MHRAHSAPSVLPAAPGARYRWKALACWRCSKARGAFLSTETWATAPGESGTLLMNAHLKTRCTTFFACASSRGTQLSAWQTPRTTETFLSERALGSPSPTFNLPFKGQEFVVQKAETPLKLRNWWSLKTDPEKPWMLRIMGWGFFLRHKSINYRKWNEGHQWEAVWV